MAIRLHNTMTGQVDPLQPLAPGRIQMYTCGPTVHDSAHIGNLRTYLAEDLLRRHLEARGLSVDQVMNITDVDDKIIAKATQRHLSLDAFTAPYIEAFFQDLAALQVQPAHRYPHATHHIPEMLELVQRLLDGGHAYLSDGSVYFRISSDRQYGKLSHLDVSGLRTGGSGRVDADEYETKEEVRDFVLWKAGQESDLASWPSPWGWGRPGWHLECSAMAITELGESFDIHCGGVDNIFPHHENEIAQSESATGKPFARHWFHGEHLVVEGGKMAKSLGNFVTLGDLSGRGHDPLTVRYHLLNGAHYRAKLHFHEEDLSGSEESLARLSTFWRRCTVAKAAGLDGFGSGDPLAAAAQRARDRFEAAMDDDLNLPVAVAALHDLAREGNRLLDEGRAGTEGCDAALGALRAADTRLGVIELRASAEDRALGVDEQSLLDQREQARADRDFALADQLRARLLEMGIQLEDTKSGTRWHRD